MIMAILLTPVSASGENILAPDDLLEIEAVGLRDFRQDMIDLNGQASFPLSGRIKSAGHERAELRKQVKSIPSTQGFLLLGGRSTGGA
jgi:polysaccharide export outer membrane protein